MNDTDFTAFMDRVDHALDELAGVMHLDLPDYDYRSDADAGRSPLGTARRALRAAGGF